MTNPSVLFNLPVLLDIINNADSDTYSDNLLIVKDAYLVIHILIWHVGHKVQMHFTGALRDRRHRSWPDSIHQQ